MSQDFIFHIGLIYVCQSGHIYHCYLLIFTNVQRHNKKIGVIEVTKVTITLADKILELEFLKNLKT